MNLVDFYLKNKFRTDNGEPLIDGFSHLMGYFTAKELLEMIPNYKGENYNKMAEFAMRMDRSDVAMEIALTNHDYKLCETIHVECQKTVANKAQCRPEAESVESAIERMRLTIEKFKKQMEMESDEADLKESGSKMDVDEFFNAIELKCNFEFDDVCDIMFNNYLERINNTEDLIHHQNLQNILRKFFPNSENMKFYFLDNEDML